MTVLSYCSGLVQSNTYQERPEEMSLLLSFLGLEKKLHGSDLGEGLV